MQRVWLFVLLIVLVLAAGLLLVAAGPAAMAALAPVVTGGGPSPAEPTMRHCTTGAVRLGHIIDHGPDRKVRGGRAKEEKAPKPKKPWTEYSTWNELLADAGAAEKFKQDRIDEMNRAPDWTPVIKHLRKPLADTKREWFGLINRVGGELRVVALAEGGDGFVSGEQTLDMCQRPALYLFHTHPHGTPPEPSGADLTCAFSHGCYEFSHLEAVISDQMVSRYFIPPSIASEVWNSGYAKDPSWRRIAAFSAGVQAFFAGLVRPNNDRYPGKLGVTLRDEQKFCQDFGLALEYYPLATGAAQRATATNGWYYGFVQRGPIDYDATIRMLAKARDHDDEYVKMLKEQPDKYV